MSVDPTSCPLCGERNACGMANGEATCWCFDVQIARATLDRIPEEARSLACICRACAAKSDAANAEPAKSIEP